MNNTKCTMPCVDSLSQQGGEDRILKTNSTEEEIILISASRVEGADDRKYVIHKTIVRLAQVGPKSQHC